MNYTSAWEGTAKMQVQQAKLENANKFMKKMNKLMDKIDPEMLVLNKAGYYDLDIGALLEAHKTKAK